MKNRSLAIAVLAVATALAPADHPAHAQEAGSAGASVPVPSLSDEDLRDIFSRVLKSEMPLDAPMIQDAIKRANETSGASLRTGAKPTTTLLAISLDPAAPVPVVYVDVNQITTMAFTDSSGEPWPIASAYRSPGLVGPERDEGSHIFRLEPKSLDEVGSVSVELKDLATPITLQVKTSPDRYFARVEVRVNRFGPKAKPPLWEGDPGLQAGDASLLSFLQGVPPAGSAPLALTGGAGETKAWRLGGDVYIRTPFTLLAPHPRAQQRVEGVNVYKVRTTPVLKFSDGGMVVDMRLRDSVAVARSAGGFSDR